MTVRLPTYFVSHGGGPWPWMRDDYGAAFGRLEASLVAIPSALPAAPRAVLLVSGHWEEPRLTVMASANPKLLYDYYGFPEHTYRISYPAPGAPEVAGRVQQLLSDAGFAAVLDAARGYDHGAFVPLSVMYPRADVPVLQLSLLQSLDPDAHWRAGEALAPLRDEGVLIVGSGMTYHDLRRMGPEAREPSGQFDRWLAEAVAAPLDERRRRLSRWAEAPSARAAHPREEHLIPLHVAAGAAANAPATRIYHQDDLLGTVTVSSFRFG